MPLALGDHRAMEGIARQAVSIFGKADLLIINGGISQRSLIIDTHMEVYQQLIQVNYIGTVALTKALLPYFVLRKSGHFVTVTSLMGKFGTPWRSGYCAAKHALHGFFDVLRMEHEKDGVCVTMVCPGFVNTGAAKNALTADGSTKGSNDRKTANGMEHDRFARKMIAAIEKREI